ncbi:hypothetical protein [Pseudomonas sp. B21-053]|uniref:hypothetical protein n=1 Tax=Pseudomonas sp. B21-053 TaxID=2895493 RepID=UPI00222E590C|nr:hypothetical protein [Pseudomonas sp. B21-053]UZE12764.1 hypothetical protein LOY68_03905 [Pseudomonas sp. B21-053]
MSKVIDFPKTPQTETIDQAFFEKFADAALLLKCFEVVEDAIDFIDEDGVFHIQKHDDTHVSLIEAYWALKVLFERKTGHDAKTVARDHLEAMRRHLLEGAPRPEQFIPVVKFPAEHLPDEAFDHLTDQQLACAAFNYSDRVRTAIMDHSPKALVMDEARVFSIDATTALRQLVLRMSGGTVKAMAAQISRKPGETLQ